MQPSFLTGTFYSTLHFNTASDPVLDRPITTRTNHILAHEHTHTHLRAYGRMYVGWW